MCISSPKVPDPTPPPQDQKAPDSMSTRRVRKEGQATMLTGPSGVSTGALNTGGNTLLGG